MLLEIREPDRPWADLSPAEKEECLLNLARCEGFLHLLSACRAAVAVERAGLEQLSTTREMDLIRKGRIEGLRYFEDRFLSGEEALKEGA